MPQNDTIHHDFFLIDNVFELLFVKQIIVCACVGMWAPTVRVELLKHPATFTRIEHNLEGMGDNGNVILIRMGTE